MTEHLFFEEMDMLLDGLINAPLEIVKHLLAEESASLEELQELFTEAGKPCVKGWLRRMMSHFAVVHFVSIPVGVDSYELTPFARDMIEHINNFRVVTKGRENNE